MRWRIPAFSVTIVALPVLFFTFFGLPYVKQTGPNGINLGAYLIASFAAYSVGSVMVFGFGIGVATERGVKDADVKYSFQCDEDQRDRQNRSGENHDHGGGVV